MTDRNLLMPTITLTALLTLPAVLHAEEEVAAPESENETVCIDTARVRDFDALSNNHVVVEESGRELYLLTIKHHCSGLRNARAIAFKDTMRRVCADDNFAEIIVRDMGRPMSCNIGNIEKVASKEAAEEIVAEREAAEAE